MNPLKLDGSPCKHPRYVLDAEDRSVHCSRCGVVVDAFDVLAQEAAKYAKHESFLARARGQLASVHNDIAAHQKNLTRLRKSLDHEGKKLNALIARRKALEDEVGDRNAPRRKTQGTFQLELEAATAAERFNT
jgi:septal ring factor EnvC (AmiA/AmiB activator)